MQNFMPEYLKPLSEDRIQKMYEHATAREAVFRNVLLDLADNDEESAFLRAATIDEIFEKHVRIEGYVTRVSNYKLGPSDDRFRPLSADELMVSIRTPGPSWEKLYKILENDQIKFVENVTVMMH